MNRFFKKYRCSEKCILRIYVKLMFQIISCYYHVIINTYFVCDPSEKCVYIDLKTDKYLIMELLHGVYCKFTAIDVSLVKATFKHYK